jgi:hypothetical protein
MRTPLQSIANDLRTDAQTLAAWSGTHDVAIVMGKLFRYADMLEPLGLGEFALVNKDGSRTPTNRVRMPKKR